MFKKIFALIVILICISALNAQEIKTFAMCRPEVGQIQNIEEMYEKHILPAEKIKVIGVYHENEEVDYQTALDYVEENNLHWFSFYVIKGKTELKDLFKENEWTPQFKYIFDNTDGIIFTGGADLPPAIYNEEQSLLTEVESVWRSYYESSFLFHLLGGSRNDKFTPFLEKRPEYTVMGICLGCQTMNVACGGTLVQDIPTEIYNFQSFEKTLVQDNEQIHSSRYIRGFNVLLGSFAPAIHKIKLMDGKITKEMGMTLKDNPMVISSHHQALEKIGKDLKVIAVSMDGKIVEAVEHTKYKNVLGVQFHPENEIIYSKNNLYRRSPDGKKDFNIRSFFENNEPSMKFHKNIWKWFIESLTKK